MTKARALLGGLATCLVAACGGGDAPLTLRLATPAFGYGSGIPATYTCEADNVSPPIGWDRIPPEAQSLVLLMEDQDADDFTHWLVYDIPTTTGGVAEKSAPQGGTVGTNDFGDVGYSGPCPPEGAGHEYMISVYALDTTLGLPPGATREQVEEAMEGHVLARGELLGTYRRH